MIILNTTSDTIRIVRDSAYTTSEVEVMASYRDTTSVAVSPGRTLTKTNGTTPVNIVPAPAASTQRHAEYISVHNADTVSATVTISAHDGTTYYTLHKCTLGVGEKAEYIAGHGWRSITNTGAIKTSLNQGSAPVTSGDSFSVLPSSVTNSNATANTMEDITGLSFAVTSGNKYFFRFVITYSVAAATTGARFSINGPTNSLLAYRLDLPTSATARTLGNYAAYDNPATSTTASGGTANIVIIEGTIIPTANGTVIARFASELAATPVIAEGGLCFVSYRQLA